MRLPPQPNPLTHRVAARCTLHARRRWVAAKLLSVRTAAPNRQLVCMATSCAADVLSWRELEVCKVLDWDMAEILREAGMI